ncbi:hypothetical protein L585_07485 [Pantoea ananatis BRT175]|nr:hypothetical protein L585_07485 [Pantoea ananatis BRT175]
MIGHDSRNAELIKGRRVTEMTEKTALVDGAKQETV